MPMEDREVRWLLYFLWIQLDGFSPIWPPQIWRHSLPEYSLPSATEHAKLSTYSASFAGSTGHPHWRTGRR